MQREVTQLLSEAGEDRQAAAKLFELVYEDLRALAAAQMRRERADHTLQATALVGEAFVRLVGAPGEVPFADSQHFYRVAAEAMRRVLVDHARARLAEKRGGGERPIPLDEGRDQIKDVGLATDPSRLLELDEALARLEQEDPRAAEIVRLRFFGGLEVEQAAEVLGVSRRTAMRDWSFARARLTELMGGERRTR